MKRIVQLVAIGLFTFTLAAMIGCGADEPAATPPAPTADEHFEGDGHDHGAEGHEGHDHEGESH